ncbi:hypothetical protein G6F68_013267 [Rhizopus microsporus]|nr:hypothetical protein G6F68_013267 [Rhizopus microsporus]
MGQGLRLGLDADAALFARLQVHLVIADQADRRGAAGRPLQVQLGHIGTSTLAGVADVDAGDQARAFHTYLQVFIGEGGVGQAVAEGEGRGQALGRHPLVTDVGTFDIEIEHITERLGRLEAQAVDVRARQLRFVHHPGHRQAAGRIDLAGQQRGNAFATADARIPRLQHRRHRQAGAAVDERGAAVFNDQIGRVEIRTLEAGIDGVDAGVGGHRHAPGRNGNRIPW